MCLLGYQHYVALGETFKNGITDITSLPYTSGPRIANRNYYIKQKVGVLVRDYGKIMVREVTA